MADPRIYRQLNADFFDQIDTEQKAYWLGFFYDWLYEGATVFMARKRVIFGYE